MPEFVNYQLQQIPIRQIDTNLVGNTLATITAGNKEALQKQSELSAVIADMDLNEAEDGFRQQLFDDITTTIEDNSIEGNAYYALDDIIKKSGDIYRNPALLGRLKAQQEYKKFNETLDARVLKGDINQDTADWAKAQNPYYYKDKVDEVTGKVIGGTEWKPGITPVKDIDFNDVFDAITKELKPETGGWSGSNGFLYSDGTTGNKFVDGKTVGVLSDSSNEYIRLTPERIKSAIQNAFQNNPQLAAQAKQSWDVLKWKAKEGKITPNNEVSEYNGTGGIFNKDGSTKSYEQYLTDMVDGYAREHQYYNKSSKTTYRDAAIARQYDIKTQQGKYRQTGKSQDVAAEFGNPAKNGYYQVTAADYVNNYNFYTNQAYQQTQSILKNQLANLGINTNEDITSVEQITELIGTKDLTAEQQKQYNDLITYASNIFEKYRSDFESIKNINGKDGSVEDGYNEILNALSSGTSINNISTENPAAIEARNQYGQLVDRSFGDNNMVGFRFKSREALNKFIGIHGGENALTTAGYKISGNNIYIDKNNSHLLYELTDNLKTFNGDYWRADNVPTNSNNDITGGLFWNISRRAGTSRDNGANTNEQEIWTKNGFENMFTEFGAKLKKKADDATTATIESQKSESLYLPQYRISSWSSLDNEVAEQSNDVEAILGTKRKKEFDSAAQQAYIDIKNGEHQDEAIRVVNNEGRAIIVDGVTKKEILEELQAVPDNAGRGFGDIIDGLGARYGIEYRINKNITEAEINRLREQGAQIITTGEKNDKGKIPCTVKREIILDYYENDDLLSYYNSLPSVVNSTRPVSKYFANSNYYYGGQKGMEFGATPYKTDNINYQWEMTIGGERTGRYLNNNQVGTFENIHFDIIDKKAELEAALAQLENKSETNAYISNYAAQLAGELYANYRNANGIFNSDTEFINYVKSVLGY